MKEKKLLISKFKLGQKDSSDLKPCSNEESSKQVKKSKRKEQSLLPRTKFD